MGSLHLETRNQAYAEYWNLVRRKVAWMAKLEIALTFGLARLVLVSLWLNLPVTRNP